MNDKRNRRGKNKCRSLMSLRSIPLRSMPLHSLSVFLASTVLIAGILSGCGRIEPVSRQIYAMDTVMTLTVYSEYEDSVIQEILDQTQIGIQEMEDELSAEKPGSPVYEINQKGSGVLSENGRVLLAQAQKISAMVDNAFDVTVYPLVKEWGFPQNELNLPSAGRIHDLLTKVHANKLSFDDKTGDVSFLDEKDYGLDFGAIAKGYAADRTIEYWKSEKILAGIMSLGGNLQCFGTKPDGSPWICGIQDPFHPEDPEKVLGILKMKEGALVTSGSYQRYLVDENTGLQYHHILDPKTGYPAQSGLVSATIYADSGAIADALSTAVFVLGKDQSVKLWEESEIKFEMVLMTEEEQVYITEGLEKDFSSDYPVEVIRRNAEEGKDE